MARTIRLLGCIAVIAITLTALMATAAEPLAKSRPNIVVVITDDQGYAPIGRHGHPWIRTPHLDRLHDQSVRFTRFLASPTCSPTRSALMTGRHAMSNGITHTMNERERLRLDVSTLPQLLQGAGYQTGIFGKWHLGDEAPYQPANRGFHESFIHGAGGIGQAYNCSCADAPGNKYFDPVIRHNGQFVKTTGYCTDLFFDAALTWIGDVSQTSQPFFAFISTNAPHSPYVAPAESMQRFVDWGFDPEHAAFYGMIENIDSNMGRLLAKLDAWQLRDQTVVIFMSDNGMAVDGSGIKQASLGKLPDGTAVAPYNANMRGLKGDVDEGGVRVPFFVSWPHRLAPARDIENVVAHIDVLPTLAELTGANLPENPIDGRSFLALLEPDGTAPEWPDRYLFTHAGRWPVGANPDDYQWKTFAVRNARFRFVNNTALYDMLADPEQTNNVIDQHATVVAEMRLAYDAWWKQTRAHMVNENQPLSATRPYHVEYEQQRAARGIPAWSPNIR